jgi:hypothetical protein
MLSCYNWLRIARSCHIDLHFRGNQSDHKDPSTFGYDCASYRRRWPTLCKDFVTVYSGKPILLAARSKAWVCGRAFAFESYRWHGCLSCTVFVLSGRGLCYGRIPRPEESYRLWCVSECDQVKINNLDTCCEQVGRRGKDCEKKRRICWL